MHLRVNIVFICSLANEEQRKQRHSHRINYGTWSEAETQDPQPVVGSFSTKQNVQIFYTQLNSSVMVYHILATWHQQCVKLKFV